MNVSWQRKCRPDQFNQAEWSRQFVVWLKCAILWPKLSDYWVLKVCITTGTATLTTIRKRGNCECIATWSRPRQSFSVLIMTSCQVWSRWTYPLPYYSVSAADTLLYAVTLTFDLKYLQRIVCDVMKLYIKFECNWAIRSRVITISVFDLMTLNIALYALHSALG